MAPSSDDSLRSHLSDFETTTSDLLRPGEARALLNFAALFHQAVYLTDTAIGDHGLIIRSFREGHHGLFFQIRRLGEAGILRILYRDKVVVGGKELHSGKLIPITKIWEGWAHRDKVEWGGETGFTTVVPDDDRRAYYREVEEWLYRNNIVFSYNPDLPKSAFRDVVRTQLYGRQHFNTPPNPDKPSSQSATKVFQGYRRSVVHKCRTMATPARCPASACREGGHHSASPYQSEVLCRSDQCGAGHAR